jgi:hypothetical protein
MRLTDSGSKGLVTTGRWSVPEVGLLLTWRPGRGVDITPAPVTSRRRRNLLLLIARLVRQGRDLKQCPHCGTPFLSPGKRRYCKPRCLQAAMDSRKQRRRLAAFMRQTTRELRKAVEQKRRRPA